MAEKDVIITFDTLFDLQRREKYRAELQKIDAKFFDDVTKYFTEKQSILESQEKKKSVFASTEIEKTRGQLNEAKRLLKDIYTWRENKIVQGAVFQSRCNGKGFDFSALLPEEIELFNALQSTLMKYREDILHSLLNHESPKVAITPVSEPETEGEAPKGLKTDASKSDGSCRISIKCDLPEFMGPDMNKYGPFEAGETASIPDSVAEMLVKSGNAIKPWETSK
ncbi:MAG: hypothetical protein QME12_03650 [Nanoarchaeota archaeon]|nr:hypothetical protein [Nanoarchaeota archaeon]